MTILRAEADAAVERAEQAEARNKAFEQEILKKDQEISSLTHRLGLAETNVETLEQKLAQLKSKSDEEGVGRSANDNLVRKVQLLEEELDTAEKNAKETVEKLGFIHGKILCAKFLFASDSVRLT
jgi:tropomyosin, fungi type